MIRLLVAVGLLLTTCFSSTAFAHEGSLYEIYQTPLPKFQSQVEIQGVPNNLRWLYEMLISAQDRTATPQWAERSFSVHTADSYRTYPHPSEIRAASLIQNKVITGRITFMGFVAKKYTYDVTTDPDGTRAIHVRVFFKNAKETDWDHFGLRVEQAELLWNTSAQRHIGSSRLDFNYRFQFDVVRDRKQAHYQVNVKDATRGPYDVEWSRGWSGRSVAHELGHMMGLGDEYNLWNSKSECLQANIMCTSNGEIQPMHHYFILRRLITPSTKLQSFSI